MSTYLGTALTHAISANFPVNKWDPVYTVDFGYFSH